MTGQLSLPKLGAISLLLLATAACVAGRVTAPAEEAIRSASGRVSDADIANRVKEALRTDVRVAPAKIAAKAERGIVTLSGSVDNIAAKKYADLEAKTIDGVLGVINEIEIAPEWRADAEVADAVRHRIQSSTTTTVRGLRVSCDNGEVTLVGIVDTWTEEQEAELLVGEVRGVTEVKNHLFAELTHERSDEEIQKDAVATLRRDVYVTGLPITVSVEDGVIRLEGSVGNAYEKERAEKRLQWVAHVRRVENYLQVKPWQNRGVRQAVPVLSDVALKRAVRAELDQDLRVDASGISIDAHRGRVTLDGTVHDHYQQRVAEQDVRDVVGVGWVTNRINTLAVQRDDGEIRSDIKFLLATDGVTEKIVLAVDVQDGVVTLSGRAHNSYEKSCAEDVASRVGGVNKVINQIDLDNVSGEEDAVLISMIRYRLRWNSTTNPVHEKIEVTVKARAVTLVGEVENWSERLEAGRIAKQTQGVRKVENLLTVNGFDYPWEERQPPAP